MILLKLALIKDRNFYKMVVSIMLPIALQQAINVGVNMMDTIMLGSFGESIISASSLANQYYQIFTVFCLGVAGGATVLAAQYWGSGDKERTRKSMSLGIQIGLAVAVLFALATFFFTEQIMRIYTKEQDVITEGVKYLKITSFIFILHGTSTIAHMLMRSIGHPKLGMVVSIASFFVNVIANYMFIFGKADDEFVRGDCVLPGNTDGRDEGRPPRRRRYPLPDVRGYRVHVVRVHTAWIPERPGVSLARLAHDVLPENRLCHQIRVVPIPS